MWLVQGPPRTAVLTDFHNSLARQGQRGAPELREWRLLPEAAQLDNHTEARPEPPTQSQVPCFSFEACSQTSILSRD